MNIRSPAALLIFLVLLVLPAFEVPGLGVTVAVAVPAANTVLPKLRTMPPASARVPIRLTVVRVFIAVPS